MVAAIFLRLLETPLRPCWRICSGYPLERAADFVHAISRSITELMVKALQQQPLMRVAYADFEELIASCRGAFKAWDDAMDSFRSLLRTMALKKKDASFGTSSLPVRTNLFAMLFTALDDHKSFVCSLECGQRPSLSIMRSKRGWSNCKRFVGNMSNFDKSSAAF